MVSWFGGISCEGIIKGTSIQKCYNTKYKPKCKIGSVAGRECGVGLFSYFLCVHALAPIGFA